MSIKQPDEYDVLIIGAGLAGLSLARQLLLLGNKRILLLDKRGQIPPKRQKVGEATVQLSAYYLAKVLDLEEHLLREHYIKYNLRFNWKTNGRSNQSYEDYSQSYIRNLSNLATYQLDRNKIEAELLRLNLDFANFTFLAPVTDLQVSLSDVGPHDIGFKYRDAEISSSANWVVDTSGRGKVLARRLELRKQNPIRHGTSFLWVDGLVNIEKLTSLSPNEIRLRPDRASLGHLPVWLATNHFMGEGYWFWVIPLQGKTSLGLVYDNRILPHERVATPEKLIKWVCEEFPLFARDLPSRTILDHGSFRDFSYDCQQTISSKRWALSGEAGRFTDPLYSPGGDLIALYNTLIVDAVQTLDHTELKAKCWIFERLMKAFYEAYVPSYAVSYDVLGDQEAMTLKYSWELAIYFAFYVFPFINDLFTDSRFLLSFFATFSQLGPLNLQLQNFISAFYQWKKDQRQLESQPIFNDFMDLGPLRTAERSFYRIGVSAEEAASILNGQLENLRELARFIGAHVGSKVLGDARVRSNRAFVESIDLNSLRFNPYEFDVRWASAAQSREEYRWSFDDSVLSRFTTNARHSFIEKSSINKAEATQAINSLA